MTKPTQMCDQMMIDLDLQHFDKKQTGRSGWIDIEVVDVDGTKREVRVYFELFSAKVFDWNVANALHQIGFDVEYIGKNHNGSHGWEVRL